MKKGIKKIVIRKGQDAKDATVKKLLYNFIRRGRIVTSKTRSRYVRSLIDRMVGKAKSHTQADHNVLLRYIPYTDVIQYLTSVVSEAYADQISGFTTLQRLPTRMGDSANMVVVTWGREVPPFPTKKKEPVKGKELTTSKKKEIKEPEKKSKPRTKKKLTS
jgi:ribosomal protein L17